MPAAKTMAANNQLWTVKAATGRLGGKRKLEGMRACVFPREEVMDRN
jgi:hypothetical protein